MAAAVKFIPFKVEHLDLADIRDHEANGMLSLPDAKERLSALQENSVAGTMVYDGRVLCAAGFIELWAGVVELWLLPTDRLKESPVVFARSMRTYIDKLAKDLKWHRMQTVAKADQEHERWLSWVGFKVEGIMPAYSFRKETYKMWARLYDGH